jgi:heat shock protein HtpX
MDHDVQPLFMRHVGLKLRMGIAGSILFSFYAVLVAIGWTYLGGGTTALVLAVLGTLLFVVFQYKLGKWMALRSVGAEDMPEDRYQQIHWDVEDLAKDMGIEKPRLMVADMGVPNAFAVGRKGDGTVVVSRELIQLLDEQELKGVLAHELAHIRNRDVVIMVLGQAIASMVGIAAQIAILSSRERGGFFMAIIVGQITQMLVMIFVFAISRYREYVADSDAASAIGQGDPLARALEKISRGHETGGHATSRGGRGHRGGQPQSNVEDQVSALCIFHGERGIMQKIFATHPPTEKRIERLRGANVR